MLLKSKSSLKLTKTYQKILYLSTAHNDTFVFLGMPGVGRQSIVHCDRHGKILFEKTFDHNVDSFGMCSEKEVLILETRDNRIAILDLESHKFSYVDHQFARQESDLADIETFYDTRMVCVKESGQYNDNRFILTYYSYPFSQDSKPVARYESQDDQWTHEYISKKANSHSMIVWFKPRNDEEIELKMFDLREDPKGKYRYHKIRNTIGEPYNLNKVEMAITDIWETKRNNFCLVTVSNKTQNKAFNKEGVVNNNFILDLDLGTLRQSKFSFEQKYNDYLIDYLNLGPICMFRTFFFQDGKVETTPVYYIDNETQTIVAHDQWQCTYRTKYYVPGFDSSTLIESEYENGDVDSFNLWVKKVLDPKEIALHFLLHINQDFDDDLLQDAIELMEHSS